MSPGRRTVVVAIGGNALSPSGESASVTNQFRHTRESLASIVNLARAGWKIAIVHGNGPQVGDELLRNGVARNEVEQLPLGVLVAATAGWIGYMIQQSRVDRADPAMSNPTKFIGRGLSESDAAELRADGVLIAEDPRGNLRRLVPSPVPVEVVESEIVRELVHRGDIVIAAGGGGIPVYRDPVLGLEGVDAVVDKDRAAAILGRDIGASVLLILTDVDGVYEDWGTDGARKIDELTSGQARSLVAGKSLGAGSMRPKLEAAVHFLDSGGELAIIAALEDGPEALAGKAGTRIRPGR